ncbi:hypothetical protein TIFTF001_005915 [Ficus carica]|uniref:Protein kinase domain-containing protein n=1 Tax=Ficus carica TaxID=3494 RepID=A0AA87ZN47_FICCA|nr:hypothetical protein TIFTF001_005915 [Ficus carica]
MFPGFGNNKREKKEGFFLKNGGAALENIISLHNGDCNPIRSYSAQQLQEATGDFRWPIDQGYKMYKGVHEDREISVKRFTPGHVDDEVTERIAKEVAIASRMSSHKNVLKLLGCCLETELPLLVYEFPTMANLESHIYDGNNKLSWEQKLRIAIGIANAVAYLHHGLRKTIIHRSIQPSNIFIDQWETAKLFELQDAIPIPEGETHVRSKIIGTQRSVAPEICRDGHYTEKVDVYAFGILLFQVLTDGFSSSFHDFYSNVSAESGSSSTFPSDDCSE